MPQRKTCCMVAEHRSCPRCVQTTHHGSSSGTIASSAGADAARTPVCDRTDQDPHVAGKQQRIGGRSSGNDHSAGFDNSRLSLANAQGKPSVWQGHHSKHLRRQAEERLSGVGRKFSAVSAQCVDECEILLEWLVSEKEHVTGTEIQTRCDVEDWEYDNINTFSRVTFVYLSMRTTGTARTIVTSGKGVTD